MRNFKTVCVSGYFDPLHRGHIEYFENAKLLGDKLIVILNTDRQRSRAPRMTLDDRKKILESIRYVDSVVLSVDVDSNVCNTLKQLTPTVFAKGDCASDSEIETCVELSVEIVQGVGSQLHLHDLLACIDI